MIRRRGKTLGLAKGRRYDLPLEEGAGNGFLMVLVALMTFLAVLALTAIFALSALTERWQVGLAHQLTVEISAVDAQGQPRKRAEIDAAETRIAAMLRGRPGVRDVHPLSDAEIAALVRPWLGGALSLADLPVPGLVSLTLDGYTNAEVKALGAQVAALDPRASLATYDDWLGDILRFARALQFAAVLVGLVVGLITTIAVAGAAQARLSVSRDNIEILHLMGASNLYISGQFQRHATVLALKGAIAGLVAGGLAILAASTVAGRLDANLMPGFHLTPAQVIALLCLPLAAALLAAGAARATVGRTLGRMP